MSYRARTLAFVAIFAATPAFADDDTPLHDCMSAPQVRAAVKDGRALRLATIKRSLEQSVAGDVLLARLCESGNRLIYALTILQRNGQVVLVQVDAASGTRGQPQPGLRVPRIERREPEHGKN